MGGTIHLTSAGAHTRLFSTLCAACPQGSTGCCAGPPAVAWSDIGRIVALGGRDWLLAQIARGDLRPVVRGLMLRRVENPDAGEGGWRVKCVYHGEGGCTIPPERRSATCNYYICDDAFADAGEAEGATPPETARARAVHEALTALYGRWDLELSEQIQARHPDGAPWDAGFLDWLGAEYERRVRASRREIRRLGG